MAFLDRLKCALWGHRWNPTYYPDREGDFVDMRCPYCSDERRVSHPKSQRMIHDSVSNLR